MVRRAPLHGVSFNADVECTDMPGKWEGEAADPQGGTLLDQRMNQGDSARAECTIRPGCMHGDNAGRSFWGRAGLETTMRECL